MFNKTPKHYFAEQPTGEVSIFPMSGNLVYSVGLKKLDKGLTHLTFDASYTLERDGSVSFWRCFILAQMILLQ